MLFNKKVKRKKNIFKKEKSNMFNKCFDEFNKIYGKKTFGNRGDLLPNLQSETSEDSNYCYYKFYAPGLKKCEMNVYYKDDYLIIERSVKLHETRILKGTYEKNTLKRFSTKSYYIKSKIEENITKKFKGDILYVTLKKIK